MTPEQVRVSQLRGKSVKSIEGETTGSIDEIYYDEPSGELEWIGVNTGPLGMRPGVVPFEGARLEPDAVYVPYTKNKVKDGPDFAVGRQTGAGPRCGSRR